MTGKTATARQSRRPVSAAGWRKANDAGPHLVTLPSGATVRIIIPDENVLLANGRLPDQLRETALLCAAHPDGGEGFMHELSVAAAIEDERRAAVRSFIEDGLELRNHLVAAMLVEPEVTPEEVARGDFPELDVRMLLEFAERRRNVDAAGNLVPVVVAREWLRVRDLEAGGNGARDGEAGGSDARADVPGADDGEV